MEKREMTEHDTTSIQVLSFMLDEEWFGVEISGIQEVLEFRHVTKVPRTPEFMLGVINLRGKVIPVVDLGKHFDMPPKEPTLDTCIIIVHVDIDGESTPLGIMADEVKEVVEIAINEISPPPRIGNRINSSFIYGMARHDDCFLVLLKLSRIFSAEELNKVAIPLDDVPDVELNTVKSEM
ncbi:MAG TPA: chemotaxis protein CheW [Cellvibrio sp.]|nr:chemotaxis protein CheW [Cellvibrio sp.]